jgi:wyosine [tRNA(Phe)-imidazoG37] synthetase (radical SAM superfamily)
MIQSTLNSHISVYGPVQSWRFGRSLGIDPIGSVSTCSFNCVYCQLGEIERQMCDRQLFIPTRQIQQDLQAFTPWDVDVITLSGSGEPTLALNLGEILAMVKDVTTKPTVVLTNGSLLVSAAVREELALADCVAVKFDAMNADGLRRINRPVAGVDLMKNWASLLKFRQIYSGYLAIQTMLLAPWSELDQEEYIALMRELCPNEIQLNTPSRPKPLEHHLEARGNHLPQDHLYPVRSLNIVSPDVLKPFAERIESILAIPVRYPRLSYSARSSKNAWQNLFLVSLERKLWTLH